ncbi:uncharacterized protein LOC124533077 [Vanessa cardui]|uniref:uncharacterized protein LOC124533077 n=1 Tax=Vanessa cardui TaxID=171605 RepID=UPI001F149592|nr:uncharacterized protein LOC124533077 [Vanessa cardui]
MQDEACEVQGALAVVLRLSRALGLAPLRFAHDRGGYIVTVSRRVAIYGYILSVCTHICGAVWMYQSIVKFYMVYSSFPVGNFITVSAIMFVTGVGSYGSVDRIKNIAKHLNLLYKVIL